MLKHVDLREKLEVDERFQEDRRDPVRLRTPPDVGRPQARRRHASADLQRRGGGDVRRLHALCDGRGDRPLDPSHFEEAKEATAELNADGFRVVAVAFKEMPPAQPAYSVADEAGLTLLGYIAFLDPPKDTAAAAIDALKASACR